MKLGESIKPISYVKAHAAEVVRQAAEEGRTFVVTQNGEAKAVIMGAAEYDRLQESLILLKILARPARSVEDGRHAPAGEVFALLREKNDVENSDG